MYEDKKNRISPEIYIEARKTFDEIKASQEQSLGKYILSLSAGIFAITINAYSIGIYFNWGYLVTVWILMGLVIILILLSIEFSIESHIIEIENLDIRAMNTKNNSDEPLRENKYAKHISILNKLSLILFIFGIIFLGIFSITNINKERRSNMSEDVKQNNKDNKSIIQERAIKEGVTQTQMRVDIEKRGVTNTPIRVDMSNSSDTSAKDGNSGQTNNAGNETPKK